MKHAKPDYEISSGNVFADLGLENAEEELAKANLAIKISRIFKKRKLTQAKAAVLLKVDQPKVSALVNGHLSGFSTERLMRFLVLLGNDVEIVVKDKRKTTAHLSVNAM